MHEHSQKHTHRHTGYKHAPAKENHIEKFQTTVLLHNYHQKESPSLITNNFNKIIA